MYGTRYKKRGEVDRARELFEEALAYSRQMKVRMWLEKAQKKLDGLGRIMP